MMSLKMLFLLHADKNQRKEWSESLVKELRDIYDKDKKYRDNLTGYKSFLITHF